jgi:hypothetical protein
VLSVALLQDIAAIPILAHACRCWRLRGAAAADPPAAGWEAAKAFGVIAAIVLGGRLLLRPALRWIARSDTPEIFTAAALLLVVATAALMQSVGCRWRWAPSWPACCWPKASTGASWKPTSSPSRACCWACSSSPWA